MEQVLGHNKVDLVVTKGNHRYPKVDVAYPFDSGMVKKGDKMQTCSIFLNTRLCKRKKLKIMLIIDGTLEIVSKHTERDI